MYRFTYRNLAIVGACVILSGCGLFGKEKLDIDGEKIPVLENQSTIIPDYAPEEVKIKLPRPVENGEWSQNGGNSVHLLGHLEAARKLKEQWSSGFGEGDSSRNFLIATPVSAYKTIFTIDADAKVSAFRLDNGKKIWKKRLKPYIKDDKNIAMKGAGLAVYNRKLYATTGFGSVFALDVVTGKKLWRFDTEMPIHIAPTVNNDKVIVQTMDNLLVALDANTGAELWRYKSATEPTILVGGASPAYSVEQDVIIAAFSTGEIRAIKASTGSPLWSDFLVSRKRADSLSDISAIKANPIIDGETVYAVGNSNILAAYDLRSGSRIWEKELGSVNQPWIAGQYMFILSNDLDLAALETLTGKVVWTNKVPTGNSIEERAGVFARGPVLENNRLLVTTSNGYVFAFSPYTGKILSFITTDEISLSPIVVKGITILTTNDADIVAYK